MLIRITLALALVLTFARVRVLTLVLILAPTNSLSHTCIPRIEGWVGRGELRIAEVKSRILVLDEFVDMLEQLGFELLTKVHSTDQKLRSTSCDFV